VRKELERIEVPGEHEARERAWAVVQAAYGERQPQPRRHSWKPLAALALLAIGVAGLLSPPGRAVLDEIREVVAVEQAQPALFSLPAGGRLLVTGDSGAWVVERDGAKRRLGAYREASWSPFGRFVAVSRPNELAAVEPDGDVRWSLARPAARSPRWTGSADDTRIAYVTDSRLHVVAGDGSRDVDAGGGPAPAAGVAPAWRPRRPFELSYLDSRHRVATFAVEARGVSWRSGVLADARRLVWSPDGSRLLVLGRDRLVLLRGRDGAATTRREQGVTAAAWAPDGRLAILRTRGPRSELVVDGRVRFSAAAAGAFADLTWSPDGRWLLLSIPQADQWLFLRARGRGGIRAVANVSAQFRSRSFPTISGWCCVR
jgi:hypothetical protein